MKETNHDNLNNDDIDGYNCLEPWNILWRIAQNCGGSSFYLMLQVITSWKEDLPHAASNAINKWTSAEKPRSPHPRQWSQNSGASRSLWRISSSTDIGTTLDGESLTLQDLEVNMSQHYWQYKWAKVAEKNDDESNMVYCGFGGKC